MSPVTTSHKKEASEPQEGSKDIKIGPQNFLHLEIMNHDFCVSVGKQNCSYNMSAMAIRKAARLLILFYPLSLTL